MKLYREYFGLCEPKPRDKCINNYSRQVRFPFGLLTQADGYYDAEALELPRALRLFSPPVTLDQCYHHARSPWGLATQRYCIGSTAQGIWFISGTISGLKKCTFNFCKPWGILKGQQFVSMMNKFRGEKKDQFD